ncbi:MAG: copper-binding protein [Verrucomicrobiales bacterium]|nr:copper-binding protein [Verrucomicrobiales bacterium]
MKIKYLLLRICFLSICLAGLCSCGQEKKIDQTMEKASTRSFKVRGIVKEVKRKERLVVIDHEEIPGYMGAMIMPFTVKDASELLGLEPGDEIRFEYRVQDLRSWIEKVQKTGKKGG